MPTWRSTRVSTGNPFGTHAGWYVNPAVWDKQNEAVKQGYLDGKTTEASVIEEMMEAPTAFWVDSKAKVTASTGGGTDARTSNDDACSESGMDSLPARLRESVEERLDAIASLIWEALLSRPRGLVSSSRATCGSSSDAMVEACERRRMHA